MRLNTCAQFSVFYRRAGAVTQKERGADTLTETADESSKTNSVLVIKPARVFKPSNNHRSRSEGQCLDVVVATQATHVDKDVPTQSIQLPSQFFVLAFEPTEVKEYLTRVRDVWPKIIRAHVGPQPNTLNSKTRSVVKLKNATRSGCSGCFLKTSAADIAHNESSIRSRKRLGIVSKARNLKPANALEGPEQE
jgi:hypothetical protein